MSLPIDTVFTISDLQLPTDWWETTRVKLGRMVSHGILKKIGKGRFYLPQPTIFGEISPQPEEMVKDLLVKDGRPVGYITGYSRWNQMGLTSQISNIIQIGTNQPKRNLQRGGYSVRFTRQPNQITEDNIRFLIILDAISNIRRIPDTTLVKSLSRLTDIIKDLDPNDVFSLTALAEQYPARLRALLGAMLENIGREKEAMILYRSLNPLTSYNYPGISGLLSDPAKWGIR